jgi:hypothetical protein
VQWIAVPAWGTTATSTFGVTLESDGRFAMAFGPVAYPRSEPAYTGAGSGYAATSPTAGPVDLSALSQPLGANEPVLYEEWRRPVTPPANPFDLPPLVAWNAVPGPRDLSLRSDSRVQVELTTQGGAPLEFPFAGTRWRTVWLNANGSLSFESTDPEDSVLNTATTFLTRWPRIAPLQRPWDPAPLGRVRVLREAGSMTFDWHVAAYGPPAYSDFSATLFRGGAFLLRYNQIAADVSGCVAGYSVGRNRPSRMEAGVDLGSRVTPPYGEGTETAVYERFSTQTRPDLEGTVVSFPLGSLPILLLGPPRIGRTFEVAIGDGPASAGLPYAAACSLGPGPTPIPPEPRPVPLDLSSPLASISLLAFPGFLGVCDGNGQARGLRVPVPGEPALVGLPVWVSFLTLGARPPLGIEGMPEGPIAFQIAP